MFAITTRVAALTSSDEDLVLDLSLLLLSGELPLEGGVVALLLLVGEEPLGLGGLVLLLGGDDLPGISLGISVGVTGWHSRHRANSTATIFVTKLIIIIFLILRLIVWDVELPAVLVPWAWLP